MVLNRVWGLYWQKLQKFRGVTQGGCTLSMHRSMQLELEMPKKLPVQYSNLLNCYVDTIFVLPNLGKDQGMSTKSGD